MLYNNLAFLPGLAFSRHGMAFFLKRCLATPVYCVAAVPDWGGAGPVAYQQRGILKVKNTSDQVNNW